MQNKLESLNVLCLAWRHFPVVYCFPFIDGLCLLSHKLINLNLMICFAEVVGLGMKAELRFFYGVETLVPTDFFRFQFHSLQSL